MATTIDLDDDLSIEESRWRGRVITAAVLFLVVAFAAAAVWYFFLQDEEVAARPTEDIPVVKTTLNSTLLISGKAQTQLSSDLTFQGSGKVAAVAVKVGDVVAQGQVLASLESEDLANAVASAEAQQRSAQLRLEDLTEGSSTAEFATADQAVAGAQAALTKAENDLLTLTDGATAADVAAGEQAVSAAESLLASAENALQKLQDAPSDADLATAQAAVTGAESALTAAENTVQNAGNGVDSAEASLKNSENTYCGVDLTPAFCTTASAPISNGDASILENALDGANAGLASATISLNSGYLSALNTENSAEAAVTAAENSLESAEARLSAVEEGASSEDINAAETSVASAQAGVATAAARLADIRDGATAEQRSNAEVAVLSARAALDTANARRAEAVRGPEANAIAQAQQGVRTAQLAADGARIRIKNTQIIAPFAGTVGAVNIEAGEFASLAAAEPAIVLLTPDRVELNMEVGETDYPNVKNGQGGVVLFDGIPGKPYPFTITEIGLSPIENQGVVTYPVKASLVVLPGSPNPAPGMNGRGQLTTDSKPDILVVPPRAVRTRGTEQVVDIRRNGTVEEQVVTTGITDPSNVEILSGLAEGDIVVVPSLTTAGTDDDAAEPLPGGVR